MDNKFEGHKYLYYMFDTQKGTVLLNCVAPRQLCTMMISLKLMVHYRKRSGRLRKTTPRKDRSVRRIVIENLWAIIKDKVAYTQPSSAENLMQARQFGSLKSCSSTANVWYPASHGQPSRH